MESGEGSGREERNACKSGTGRDVTMCMRAESA
jgi:hypothetical protein